jgi:hypothetical protein
VILRRLVVVMFQPFLEQSVAVTTGADVSKH